MSFKQLFKKKYFYLNILLAFVIIFILSFITLKWLNSYTRHGENILLPDFIGKDLDSLIEYTEKNDLHYVVMDSVFDDSKPKGSIVLQDPLPLSNIKKERTVYVSIVSQQSEMSVLPNLINLSVRQGVNLLLNNNLGVEKLIFQEGFDRNAIQKVTFNGEDVEAGTKLLKKSKLEIYVSIGTNTYDGVVPDVVGLSEEKAIQLLLSNSFNLGQMDYENQTQGVTNYVYHQFPLSNSSKPLGSRINLRFDTHADNIKKLHQEALILYDSTYYMLIDSTAIDSLELEEL